MCPFRKLVVLVLRNLAFPSLIVLCTLYFVLCTLSGPARAGMTTRVSVASDGTQGNNSSGSSSESITADGRFVVLHSSASDLVPGDTNGCVDVFVHDRQTGQTTRISVASKWYSGKREQCFPLHQRGRAVRGI